MADSSNGFPMSSPPAHTRAEGARETRRSRTLLLWIFLLLAGMFIPLYLLVVAPMLKVRHAIRTHMRGPSWVGMQIDAYPAFSDLGGEAHAWYPLRLYLHMPDVVAPDKHAAVSMIGLCGKRALPELERWLLAKDSGVKICALGAIYRFGPDAKGTVNNIVPLLHDPENSVRIEAAETLAAIAPGVQSMDEVESVVVGLIKDPSSCVIRIRALALLPKTYHGAKEAIPAILRALATSNDRGVRMQAALTLGKMGDRSSIVISALTDLLRDPDHAVAGNALAALTELGAMPPPGADVAAPLVMPGSEAPEKGESDAAGGQKPGD